MEFHGRFTNIYAEELSEAKKIIEELGFKVEEIKSSGRGEDDDKFRFTIDAWFNNEK